MIAVIAAALIGVVIGVAGAVVINRRRLDERAPTASAPDPRARPSSAVPDTEPDPPRSPRRDLLGLEGDVAEGPRGVVIDAPVIGVGADAAHGDDGRIDPRGTVDAVDDVGAVLREAMNELEIGVVVCSSTGAIVYRNQTAAALGGTHVGVIVDQHMEKLLAGARGGQRSSKVIDLHGPPTTWLALEAAPMPNGAAVATVQDVSERVRVDAMRTDFVANISHELRTPVGAIAVLAETLSDEDSPEVVARVADRMVSESHRAVRTIDDLLELSRIESAKPGDDLVDMSDVVNAAVARGRVADGGRGIRVSAFDPGATILVRADRRQLVSAIGNLVENAVKYSDDDGVVQVRTRVDDRYVEVMVADQGVGIPQRDLDRIFERFYRVDKARSRGTGGTGLGLAIVRHVATNHGGDVQVSSAEGEGSTFVFRLPASLVVDASTATKQNDGPSAESSEKENSP